MSAWMEPLEERLLLSGTAEIYGTAGDDIIGFDIGDSGFVVTVNGEARTIAFADFKNLVIDSLGGMDSITVKLSAAAETVNLRTDGGAISSAKFSVTMLNTETKQISGSGSDVAILADSGGDDRFVSTPDYADISGIGFYNYVSGFGKVYAYATSGGNDIAVMYDSSGDDRFESDASYGCLQGGGFYDYAFGFDYVYAYASSGENDVAIMYDSGGDDRFASTPSYGYMQGDGFYDYAAGFDYVCAYATAGSDTAVMYDSAGDDRFGSSPSYGYMQGNGFYDYANGFDYVYAYATSGGSDTAYMYDSAGDDRFGSTPSYGYLQGNGFYDYAEGFDSVYAYATSGGNDIACMYDSPGDDWFSSTSAGAYLQGSGFYDSAVGFDYVYAYATAGGDDTASLYDSAGSDRFTSTPTYGVMQGGGSYDYAGGFDYVFALGSGGPADTAYIYGGDGDDTGIVGQTWSSLAGGDFYDYAVGFRQTFLYGQGGSDEVFLNDPSLQAVGGDASFTVSLPGGASASVSLFEQVQAYTPEGLVDAALSAEVVSSQPAVGSYANALDGDWRDDYVSSDPPMAFVIGLGREVDIKRIELVWDNEYNFATDYMIEVVDYSPTVSDARSYQTIADARGRAGQVQTLDVSGESITAAFLRVRVTGWTGGAHVVLRQIRVLGAGPTEIQSILLNPEYRQENVYGPDDPANPLRALHFPLTVAMQKAAQKIIEDAGGRLSDHQKIITFMSFLNDARVGYASDAAPEAALLEGIGACGAWSNILVAFAASVGLQARIIGLYNYPWYESTQSYDGHVVTEILIGGKWRMYDPTYGVYYTTDPGNQVDPDVLSFDELKTGRGRDPDITRIVGNPVRLAGGGLEAEAFAGPDIYVEADPSGVIGPEWPMVFPQSLDLEQRPVLGRTDLSTNQGSWVLGSAELNVSQLFTLTGLTAGTSYTLTADYSGAGGYLDGRTEFDARSKIVSGGEMIGGSAYAYLLGAANDPWVISFTAQDTTAQVLLTHSYLDVFYLLVTSYTLAAAG